MKDRAGVAVVGVETAEPCADGRGAEVAADQAVAVEWLPGRRGEEQIGSRVSREALLAQQASAVGGRSTTRTPRASSTGDANEASLEVDVRVA